MSPPVTQQFLLEGAAYALEQCGLLLRDANILYRSGSSANAIVLAAFACEELGRSRILLDLRKRVLDGNVITTEEIKGECEDHVEKQREGMLSTVTRFDGAQGGLGKLVQIINRAPWQSAERKSASEELSRAIKQKERRIPKDRHDKRKSALYVEPLSDTRWNRPKDTSSLVAREFLQGAVDNYKLQYDQGYITSVDSILKQIDAELYDALKKWSDRPDLWYPEGPDDKGG